MCSHWSQIRGKLEELFYGLVFWGFLFAKKLVETEEFENFESGFLCDPFFHCLGLPFFFVTGVGSRQSNYLEVIFIFAWN